MASKGKKTDIGKQGLSSIKNAVVKNNLMGLSSVMDKKGWVDSQGNKGKVRGSHCGKDRVQMNSQAGVMYDGACRPSLQSKLAVACMWPCIPLTAPVYNQLFHFYTPKEPSTAVENYY